LRKRLRSRQRLMDYKRRSGQHLCKDMRLRCRDLIGEYNKIIQYFLQSIFENTAIRGV
jgi:hypothetical protein